MVLLCSIDFVMLQCTISSIRNAPRVSIATGRVVVNSNGFCTLMHDKMIMALLETGHVFRLGLVLLATDQPLLLSLLALIETCQRLALIETGQLFDATNKMKGVFLFLNKIGNKTGNKIGETRAL